MGALTKALAPQSSYAAKKTDLWQDLLDRLTDCLLPEQLAAFQEYLTTIDHLIPGAWWEPLNELIEKCREEIEAENITAILRNRWDGL